MRKIKRKCRQWLSAKMMKLENRMKRMKKKAAKKYSTRVKKFWMLLGASLLVCLSTRLRARNAF